MAHAPTLTPYTDRDPSPRVVIDFATLAVGTAFVDVYAIADGELTRIVRDAARAEASGGFIGTDVEVPIGRPVTYQAEMFNAAGVSLGLTDSATTTVPVTNRLEVYIADPLDPYTCAVGLAGERMGDDIGKERVGEFATVTGSPNGPVVLGGAMQGITGIDASFYSPTDVDKVAFETLRDQTHVAVLRCPPNIELPGTLYVALLDPRRQRINDAVTKWTWGTRQASAPKAGVVVPLHTYADYEAFYPTYAAAMAVFLTYRAAVLNPPPKA